MVQSKALGDPIELKRRLSPAVLKLSGVSGIGVPKGQLTVYLESDSDEARARVREVVRKISPETEVMFLVTGKLSKQDDV